MKKYRPSPAERRFAEAAADRLIAMVELAVARKAGRKLPSMPATKSKAEKSINKP